MLCLEVAAPFNRVYEILAGIFKKLYSFCICDSAEIVRDELFKTVDETLFKMRIEELHVIGAGVEKSADNVLEHILSYLDNVVKFSESYLGLNVPEFSEVLGSIGVLGSE